MTEQPSNYEIGRRLDEVALNLRDGFDRMNLRLDRYVLAEVHNIQVGEVGRRIAELESELDTLKADRSVTVRWIVTTILASLALLASITFGVITIL